MPIYYGKATKFEGFNYFIIFWQHSGLWKQHAGTPPSALPIIIAIKVMRIARRTHHDNFIIIFITLSTGTSSAELVQKKNTSLLYSSSVLWFVWSWSMVVLRIYMLRKCGEKVINTWLMPEISAFNGILINSIVRRIWKPIFYFNIVIRSWYVITRL